MKYTYIELSYDLKLDRQTTVLSSTTSATVNKTLKESQSMVTQSPDSTLLTTAIGTVGQSTVTAPPATTTITITQGTEIQGSVSQLASATQQPAALTNATNQGKTNFHAFTHHS